MRFLNSWFSSAFAMCVLMTGCVKFRDPIPDAPAAPSTDGPLSTRVPWESENVIYKLNPVENQPGSYTLVFSNFKKYFACTQLNGVSQIHTVGSLRSKIVKSGEAYSCSIGDDERDLGSTIRIDVPNDIVVSSRESLTDQKSMEKFTNHVGRVFLENGSEIKTNGINLTIEARQVIAKGGAISSFDTNAPAQPGHDGRNAGYVLIRAQEIIGRLIVRLDGEDAGRGLAGEPIPEPPRVNGFPDFGDSMAPRIWCKDCKESLTKENAEHKNWIGPKGTNGRSGNPGGNGGRGGDSGSLYIQANKLKEEPSFIANAGKGGAFGVGGPPQPGGLGGPTAKRRCDMDCQYGQGMFTCEEAVQRMISPIYDKEGPRGDPGPLKGPDGKPGLPGTANGVAFRTNLGSLQKRSLAADPGI